MMLMGFLMDNCHFTPLNEKIISRCRPFTCGDEDLDTFFINDAVLFEKQLLGKSYCFILDENPSVIVCIFTIANDSVRTDSLPNNRKRKIQKDIPFPKRMRRYPGVLIARLGVNRDYSNKGIGTEVLNFIKEWFVEKRNKTGCRFVMVDAYNQDRPLSFYLKNNFEHLFATEKQEMEENNISGGMPLKTRMMFYDLINSMK